VAAEADASKLVLLGPPGSGKGTQAEVIAQKLGVPHISTGDMLREAVAEGSELGRKVESIMNSGALVDDDTMAQVVRERLAKEDARQGFILDGYPRTLPQAETLESILSGAGDGLDGVVLIDVPEDELVRRSLARQRADDTEEVIRERQRVYREKTEPLIGHYRELGLLREVDGDAAIEDVTARILEVVG
jgi:adenylate kinase